VENLFKISQYYQIDMKELLDENGTIVFSSNEIKGGNDIFANNIPSINTVNIQPSAELMESILKTQEQISKLLDSQVKLMSEFFLK